MILSSDYHTHTVFSHGKGKIIDNANMAKEKGLIELGISDHGFAHSAFGVKKRELPKMKKECGEATEKTGVKVLLGIESNVLGVDGTVDLKPKLYDAFDMFFVGVHKFIMYKIGSNFSYAIPNLLYSTINKKDVPKELVKRDTEAYINVIKKNPIDAITHLNFCCFSDPVEVAKVAADYGTYIELNSKKVHLTDEEICNIINKTDARFIINSDAHSPSRVGEIKLVEEMIKRVDFPLDRIDNIDGRLPKFRFKSFKEKG